MWIIRWVLWVLLLLFVIYFGAENSSQMVRIKFANWQTPELQLWVVMFFSFAVGMIVWLLGSIFKILQLKTEIRKANKANTNLKKELDKLRNITIDEDLAESNVESEGDNL
ncbi:MAG: LapA family protein [candidate division KSB1 bacterium]|nr:LapA family protein [candidate division KSB1 bacterium]